MFLMLTSFTRHRRRVISFDCLRRSRLGRELVTLTVIPVPAPVQKIQCPPACAVGKQPALGPFSLQLLAAQAMKFELVI